MVRTLFLETTRNHLVVMQFSIFRWCYEEVQVTIKVPVFYSYTHALLKANCKAVWDVFKDTRHFPHIFAAKFIQTKTWHLRIVLHSEYVLQTIMVPIYDNDLQAVFALNVLVGAHLRVAHKVEIAKLLKAAIQWEWWWATNRMNRAYRNRQNIWQTIWIPICNKHIKSIVLDVRNILHVVQEGFVDHFHETTIQGTTKNAEMSLLSKKSITKVTVPTCNDL